jgi:hypothetical protein
LSFGLGLGQGLDAPPRATVLRRRRRRQRREARRLAAPRRAPPRLGNSTVRAAGLRGTQRLGRRRDISIEQCARLPVLHDAGTLLLVVAQPVRVEVRLGMSLGKNKYL